jgi:hypothetical protein
MALLAGTARTCITPFWGVELTGWGYYLERTWERIHDDLHATALVLENAGAALAIVSLDLMVLSADFTRCVREMAAGATGLPPEHILVCCTHTHNAPASGGLLGVGEVDPFYEEWAAKQAATALILAWRSREPARLAAASTTVSGLTYNRTREQGPVDPTLATLRADRTDGSPLAILVNFQAHPTVHTRLRPREVTRNVPGEICHRLKAALPGAKVLYLQGACGDVNFLPEFQTAERCREPARILAEAALGCQTEADELRDPKLAAATDIASIPTRRWTREEIERDRAEAERRLRDKDVSGWQETIGRAMTNNPADMVERHGGDEWKAVQAMCRFNLAWTELMLRDWDTRPEVLRTEVQALRIGELGIVANSSELFSSFALNLRQRSPREHLMVACYANGRIGYVPDAYDIARRSYAAYQSPKYCNQFPFVPESGPALCEGMLRVLRRCGSE